MPAASSPELRVLVALRLCSLAEPDTLTRRTGLAEGEVRALLADAARAGWVRHREGRLHGWAITAAGRARARELLAQQLDRSGRRDDIEDLYREFLGLNRELLETCTAWQLRDDHGEPVVNRHDDPAYDRACRARLGAVHEAAAPIVERLASLIDRFEGYPARLDGALAHLDDGDLDYFTSPRVDSYHTVWFELHEHLLATLDRERADEGATV